MVDIILESWDRQAKIVENVAAAITGDTKRFASREGEWPIYHQLCHIHTVRRGWLREIDPKYVEGKAPLFNVISDEEWIPIEDLSAIRARLAESAASVRLAMEELLPRPGPVGPYDQPLFFLQHMIWHEGWHVGAIIHALRANGHEMDDAWEEHNIWGLWRTEETE
jgi:uncharacterized damage-inducible protein DinB